MHKMQKFKGYPQSCQACISLLPNLCQAYSKHCNKPGFNTYSDNWASMCRNNLILSYNHTQKRER